MVSTEGDLLTYELSVYIPSKQKIKPPGNHNLLSLIQINVVSLLSSHDPRWFRTSLPFLIFDDGTLRIRTHHEFTWKVKTDYTVVEDPLDKWIKFKFEINSTSDDNGYLKVFVNDELMVHEIRPTIPPDQDATTYLRFGIYNAFLSQCDCKNMPTQVVYFDEIRRARVD